MARRRWRPWWVAAFAVLLTVGLFAVAVRTASPEQKANAHVLPNPGRPTAALVERTMVPPTVGRGSAITHGSVALALDPEVGSVVTANPLRVGARLTNNTLLVEVDGHPVVLFDTRFPPYRDLHVTDAGADVLALKSAARSAGYAMTAGDTLAPPDLRALGRLYAAHGYKLPDGKTLPKSWWLGGVALPTRVDRRGAGVGTRISGPSTGIKVTRDRPRLSVSLVDPLVEAPPAGTRLTWELPGETVPVRIATAVLKTGDDGTQTLLIEPSQPLPDRVLGMSGKVTISSPDPRPALAAPITALVEDAEGRPCLELESGRGHLVPVEVGVQQGGWVAVTAPQLQPGDRVFIR